MEIVLAILIVFALVASLFFLWRIKKSGKPTTPPASTNQNPSKRSLWNPWTKGLIAVLGGFVVLILVDRGFELGIISRVIAWLNRKWELLALAVLAIAGLVWYVSRRFVVSTTKKDSGGTSVLTIFWALLALLVLFSLSMSLINGLEEVKVRRIQSQKELQYKVEHREPNVLRRFRLEFGRTNHTEWIPVPHGYRDKYFSGFPFRLHTRDKNNPENTERVYTVYSDEKYVSEDGEVNPRVALPNLEICYEVFATNKEPTIIELTLW